MDNDNRIEIWKDIPKYENLYQVSNFGRVKSLPRYIHWTHKNYSIIQTNSKYIPEKILCQNKKRSGYYEVKLYNGKTANYFLVHRLVAKLFIPNINNFSQVNHKDENKLNNSVENLEWCDSKYNANYGSRNRKISLYRKESQSGKYNPYHKPVLCIETGIKYDSCIAAEKKLGLRKGAIASASNPNEKRKTAGGYHWQRCEVNNG